MVLLVRSDLEMGKGKICAQCCHAAVGVCREIQEECPDLLDEWENIGAMKIALKVKDESELLNLVKAAKAKRLPHYVVHDAGHTQVAPNTRTVCAIGPAPVEMIDAITGGLKLL